MFQKIREQIHVWRIRYWSKGISSWDDAMRYGERVVEQKQEVDNSPSRFVLIMRGIGWLFCNTFYMIFAIVLIAFELWLLMQIPIPWLTRR